MKKTIIFLIFALVMVSAVSAGIGNYLTGLIFYYNFTGNAVDSSGNSHDGTVNGTGVFREGYFGQGLYFDKGGDDFVQLVETDDSDFMDNNINFTIALWFKLNHTTAGQTQRIVRKKNTYSWDYAGDGQEFRFRIYNSTGGTSELQADSAMNLQTWYFGAVSYNDSTMSIYINGTKVKTGARQGGLADNAYDLTIGISDDFISYGLNGTLDEVKFWNRALSDDEIMGLYLNETAGYSIFNDTSPPAYAGPDWDIDADGDCATGDGSSGNPFCSIFNLSSVTIEAGDKIVFDNCDVHRGTYTFDDNSGTSGSRIVFTSNGSCSGNAKLWGSYNYSSDSQWHENVSNIWQTPGALPYSVYLVYHNVSCYIDGSCNATVGQRETSFSGLNSNWDYYYNSSSDSLFVYLNLGNPADYGNGIEIPQYMNANDGTVFKNSAKDYVTIENLDFAFCGYSCLNGQLMGYMTINNSRFEHSWSKTINFYGGGVSTDTGNVIQNVILNHTGRRGCTQFIGAQGEGIWIDELYGVEIGYSTINDNCGASINGYLTNNNYVHHTIVSNSPYDNDWTGAIYFEGGNNTVISYNNISNTVLGINSGSEADTRSVINVSIHHNLVVDTNLPIILKTGNNAKIYNANVSSNTFISTIDKSGSPSSYMALFNNVYGFIFKDNLVYNSYSPASSMKMLRFYNKTLNISAFDSDYNIWYSEAGDNDFEDDSDTYTSLAEFTSIYGDDANSEAQAVVFSNYHPISTSIACTMSSTGSYVGALACYDAPPDPVTNLGNVSVTNESIYINWTNPTDYGDLNNTYIYLNGNFVGNISKDEDGWTNYSLINNTAYRFDVITTDNTGNLGTNGTITITTLQNTYYPPESGIFPEIVNNGRYTINFTFLQKPYFLYLNITGNNTGNVPMEWQWTASSSVSDLTCSGNENDNNYATYCRPASGNTDEHHINKTFYNHANYTDRELHGTIYFQARYNSYVTAYCYGSSSYQSIGTYYGGSLGDYVTVYQNFTIPEACRDESTIKMKYVFKSTYGSGYSFYFNDAEIYTVAPYYIQFMGTTIFNSTNATDTSFEMNLTGHGNNITGNKFNITYGTAGLSTFNYNVSYGFLYNKSINISILNSATNTSLNPLCSFNGAVVYPSSAFIYYNSSLTNWLNCTLSGYASVSSYIYPTYNNLTLYMGAFDLNISIYDEQIDQLITNKSIYIYIIQGSYAANYSTSNGTLFLSALTMPTGSFEIRYGGLNDDYATRSYFVTLQNASSIELYTVLLNQSSLITFNVIDERGYPVTDAYLKVQRYFIADGAYKLVGMETIDDTGTAGMYLVPNTVPYIVYVEKDSEVVFLSTANKIFMDTIQIYASLLDNPLESFYKINQQLTSYLAYSNATKLLTYFWNDASGIVTTACLEVTYRGSTGIGTLTSSCTSAASGTIVLNMTGLMLNNTEYEAHGKVYTNTAYSEYITDFLVLYHAAGIYEALGKTGLFFSWFLIITMFFVGITIAFDVAVIYTALAMIVVTVIGSAWFSVGLIAAICLLGVLMAIASKRT